MSRKDTGDSREELPFVKLEDVLNVQPDLISCNEILEKFLESKMSEQHLTVSNIEDGSYLLKMNIGPFPPLTCLIAENDWAVMMQKVVATMQSSIGTTLGTNSHPSPKYTAEKAMGVREKGLSAGHSPSTSFERVLRSRRSPSYAVCAIALRMPDRVDRSPAVSPASVSSLKPAKTEDPSQLSPSTSCGRRFSAAKSPPEPAPVTDVQDCYRKNTRSLKVRFHRVGGDRYKVIGVGGSTILSKSQADNQNSYKSSSKSGRKKAKKSKYESSELVGNNDEMAYMIDESTVAESHSDMGSPQLLNGSGSTDSLSEGDNYSHSFSMDAKCSITKSLERSEQAADDTVVWSANLKVSTSENGESDSSPVPSQSRVMHHTWKRKHRRGDPVKVSSYVTRQSSPVSATILVHNHDRLEKPERKTAGKEESFPNGEARRWRGRSLPPVLRTQEFMAKRDTESAPPAIIKAEPLDPNFHPGMSSCIELAAGCGDNGARNVKVVVKKELEESLDRLPSSVSRTRETTIVTARRAPNRPKKIRPRAGRRTGERVTADDQISSDDFTTGRISDPAEGSNASEADPGAIDETEKSPQLQDGPSRRSEGTSRLKKHHAKDDESLVVSIRRWSSVDAYLGDNDEEGRDGLVIAEEDQQSVVLGSEKPLGGNISDAVTSYVGDDGAAPASSDHVCENERADAHVEEEQEEEAEYEDEEEQGEVEHEVSDERSESEVSRLSLQSSGSRPVEGSLEYRFQLWSEAYKKFRTNPYFNSEGDVGKAPQFVRYPPRSTSEVHVVIKSGKAYALLRGRFEVAIKLPVKGPNPTNWKEILVGDVVWVRWRKNEHWPATVYDITDTVPVKVTVFWVNDKTQSTVDYWQVDLFDMAFHLRFDSRRSDPKYVRAVVTALRYMGKMGFWETFLTRKIYEELVKEEGPSFCQHISAEDIKRIKSKKARPLKISKEKKKEDQILLQKSEELLQALQASHFIFSYEDPPLVGSAYPLTNQVLEDYLGSACCASRNSEPLFEDGSKPYFETSQKYDIDPEVMGSNEIYHPDNGVAHPVEVINAVTIGCDTLEAEDVEVFENSCSSPSERVTEYISVAIEEEKPPTMEPFSEIDALRRDHPYRLPPKKRHRFKSCSNAKPPKVRRQN